MHLPKVAFVVTTVLAAIAHATADNGTDTAVATPNTPLKPLLDSNNRSKREEHALRGLLQTRQSTCAIGTFECSSGGCCPAGGECCTDDNCCDTARRCCAGGGCCELNDVCAVDHSTGERGCCPVGKTCVGSESANAAMGLKAHLALYTGLVTVPVIFFYIF